VAQGGTVALPGQTDGTRPGLAEAAQPGTREQAAELSAELGVEILWCPLGLEVPRGDGSIKHTWDAETVRKMLAPPC
jgi:hypothetical protein